MTFRILGTGDQQRKCQIYWGFRIPDDIYYNKICEILDKGLGRQIDKTVMTFGIIAMVNWAYRWFIDNGRLSIEDVAEHITHVFFSGILKDGVLTKPSHSIK